MPHPVARTSSHPAVCQIYVVDPTTPRQLKTPSSQLVTSSPPSAEAIPKEKAHPPLPQQKQSPKRNHTKCHSLLPTTFTLQAHAAQIPTSLSESTTHHQTAGPPWPHLPPVTIHSTKNPARTTKSPAHKSPAARTTKSPSTRTAEKHLKKPRPRPSQFCADGSSSSRKRTRVSRPRSSGTKTTKSTSLPRTSASRRKTNAWWPRSAN